MQWTKKEGRSKEARREKNCRAGGVEGCHLHINLALAQFPIFPGLRLVSYLLATDLRPASPVERVSRCWAAGGYRELSREALLQVAGVLTGGSVMTDPGGVVPVYRRHMETEVQTQDVPNSCCGS